MSYSLVAAFVLGLSSALHCLAMCGGIMGALSMSLREEVRDNKWNLASYVFAYNAGRMGSYVLAGLVIGTLGETIFTTISPQYGHTILRVAAALIMVGIGLYLAGWFPRLAVLEGIGVPLWRIIEPASKRFIPAHTRLQALIYGAIWGWLPCGLVYSALIMTASSGGATQGAVFMLVFGAGTLPIALATGVMSGQALHLARTPYIKQFAGLWLFSLTHKKLLLKTCRRNSLTETGKFPFPMESPNFWIPGWALSTLKFN